MLKSKTIAILFAVVVFSWLASGQVLDAAVPCESLVSLSLPNAAAASARTVAAGAFTPPSGNAADFKNLPPFCRVALTLKPSSDSDIRAEVWMPAEGWNGRFQGNGTAGMGGAIPFNALAASLRQGYATAASDTGHQGDSSYAIAHQEKVIDFAYRSFHETTVKAKAVIAAFYGNGPKFSYMDGCGTGAQYAQAELQRYPEDYNGIAITGFSNKSNHVFWQMWAWYAAHQDEASNIPPDKYKVLHNAVLQQCDLLDGIKDGVLEDPRQCKVDLTALQCKAGAGPNCLTAPQMETVRKIYAGPKNPRTGKQIFPPPYPGSELTWYRFTEPKPFALADDFFRYFVFKDANWDPKKRPINFDTDVALADSPQNGVVNAMDPDLSKFVGRGGKFLLYEGWSDTSIPPDRAIQYYKDVVAKLGTQKAKDSVRLFMVPGMAHCSAGEAHGTFDSLKVLEQWVENKKPPGEIVVSRINDGKAVRTRRLCQYPLVATYKGTGSTDDAANFVCKASAK